MSLSDEPIVDLSQFRCHQCGNCCRGEGTVRVSLDKLRQISDYLGMDMLQTAELYLRLNPPAARTERVTGMAHRSLSQLLGGGPLDIYLQADGYFHLKAQDNASLDCIFLDRNGCQIHRVKPDQCASFPFSWRNSDSFETCAGLQALVVQSSIKSSLPETEG